MSALTRDQIAAKILLNLEDAGIKFFSASDVNNSIQDGYDDVCCYCGQIEKNVTIAFQSKLVYYDAIALIPDFLAVVAIYNYNTKKWLVDTSHRELDLVRWDWEIWHGDAIWFAPHDFRNILLCPTLSTATGNMEIFYKASANTLSGSTVPMIRGDATKLLEYYSTGDLLESVKEYEKADFWQQQYIQERESYKSSNKNMSQADRMFMIAQSQMRTFA